MSALEQFLTLNVLAFMLTFVRIGTAVMIMPGVGDSFVPANIRLFFALAFSVVLAPFVMTKLPQPIPAGAVLMILILIEFLTGAFIGTIARIIMTATDTAGMMISFQAGLSNAQLFNPQLAAQGSLMGAFMSITAATLLFVLNLHHIMIYGLLQSYDLFPMGQMVDPGSMADMVTRSISAAFDIATHMAAPFIVLILVLYAAMGVLSRLMPALQIFMISLPVQLLLSFFVMVLSFSGMMMVFTSRYAEHMGGFLGG